MNPASSPIHQSEQNQPLQARREFLKQLTLAAAALLLASHGQVSLAASNPASPGSQIPRRKLGRHDITVSSLCLGGHALGLATDEDAQKIVDHALDLGLDFFDNAWDYHSGRSEELMGRCIRGKRDRVFIMTKVCTHDSGGKKEAMTMLEESLRRLGTDHLDLWQVHALATQAQVKKAFAPGGVIEALDEARQQGKIRFTGFTGHTEPDVHLAMLSHGYAFDACQLPISAIEVHSDAFVRRVLPELIKQNIAPLAMKTLGGNAKPIRDRILTVREGIGYGLSLPVATVVSGITSLDQLKENAAIATAFKPFTASELAALEERCKDANESQKYEPYRKWMSYRDGDAAQAAALA